MYSAGYTNITLKDEKSKKYGLHSWIYVPTNRKQSA